MDQYLYLSSDQSPIHPSNTPNDFTVELPRGLNLDGRWEYALVDVNRRHVDIYCDWCEEVIVGETWLPMLRRVEYSIKFPLYVSVRRGSRSRIRIYLNGGEPPKLTRVTLHLRYKSN